MRTTRTLGLVMLWAVLAGALMSSAAADRPRDRWDFKFKDFVVGSWWGPAPTDPDVKLYVDCGFNIVMVGRYMELPDYAHPEKVAAELDSAHKYGLGAMIDTYTLNTCPWGNQPAPKKTRRGHHCCTFEELVWIYKKFGHHPAVVGILLGDDQHRMTPRTIKCTDFLFKQPRPHLFPWICGIVPPKDLAEHNNPIENPQIYPTLYQWKLPADQQAMKYCQAFAYYAKGCRDYGVIFWPMLNVYGNTPSGHHYLPSDSLLRMPAYAALAYGAEGVWYFTYARSVQIYREGGYKTMAEAKRALLPSYWVLKRVNWDLRAWGKRVLGRRWEGIFGTAFRNEPAKGKWPWPEEVQPARGPAMTMPPARGKLIESMSTDMIAGVLTKPGSNPLVMLVDCRVDKTWATLPRRKATVRFAPAVNAVRILSRKSARTIRGRKIAVKLEAGGGQMVELVGDGLARLCATDAIYAAPPTRQVPPQPVSGTELKSIRAAKLRIDVFGSNGGPRHAAKYIELNGHRLCQVPANNTDAWTTFVIDLTPEQVKWIRRANEIVVRTQAPDLWKFRNLTLAVQLADGRWVKTNSDTAVHSSPGWAYSEGKLWRKDGVAGPIVLQFARPAGEHGCRGGCHGHHRHEGDRCSCRGCEHSDE